MDMVVKLYRDGLSMAEIARQTGQTTYVVRQRLLAAGVEIRKPALFGGGGVRKAIPDLPVFNDNATWFVAAYGVASIPQIARHIGRSVGFVAGRLKKYGIETRSLSEASRRIDRDRAIAEYKRLGSLSKAAKALGCSLQGLKNVLVECDQEITPTSVQFSGSGNPF